MRFVILLLGLLVAGCTVSRKDPSMIISLAGEWGFKTDSLDEGISEKWYLTGFNETVSLPGSMAENGKGNPVTLATEWTGDIIDRSFFTEERYEKYRTPENFKVPFWLQPVLYYKGAAWYQKEFEYTSYMEGRRVLLSLERPHWETTLFVNGEKAGSENSLAVAHVYDITDYLTDGTNKLTIRVDNRMVVPVGVNSHSVSDHTQSNWNGITGDICLRIINPVFIDDVAVFPDVENRKVRVNITVSNRSGNVFRGSVVLRVKEKHTDYGYTEATTESPVVADDKITSLSLDLNMGDDVKLWNEYQPDMYVMESALLDQSGDIMHRDMTDFGMREFTAVGTRFHVNGKEIFLRGTLECCIFPETGYPPADVESWEKVLGTFKEYGLNTVRFHSWCPPEAAFVAADKTGMYFHIECSSWANQGTSLGEGGLIDDFIYQESDRILKAYGNHPSFCMLAYGNEPAGDRQNEYLGKLLGYWKEKDPRHLYTSAAGWPFIPENQYNLSPEPRIQRWGEGLKSIINREPPQTMYDFRDYVSDYNIPVVSHEIGEWCVYPDFREIDKYKGVLKAKNFEIFRESLEENGMGDQAEEFLMASGRLQALCYKADIEAALRTPGFAGFHLLQLHDFPGQGSALVGILNPFFESKGYIKPEEFRMFCNDVVPLARLKKHVYQNNEIINAEIEVANYGPTDLHDMIIASRIISKAGDTLFTKKTGMKLIERGNCISLGSFDYRFENILQPFDLRLDVSLEGTGYHNSWDIWVYPENISISKGNVYVTESIDRKAEAVLRAGGSVLYLPYGKVAKDKGAGIAIGFSSIFWNTAWTNNQPPHTLGILCDPEHPAFGNFPTEYHSNWQWWDPVSHSQAMMLEGFPLSLRPVIQPVDDWFENRKLALAFEARTGGGKIMVCSIDMKDMAKERVVTRQLMSSLLSYMNSPAFNPDTEVEMSRIWELTEPY